MNHHVQYKMLNDQMLNQVKAYAEPAPAKAGWFACCVWLIRCCRKPTRVKEETKQPSLWEGTTPASAATVAHTLGGSGTSTPSAGGSGPARSTAAAPDIEEEPHKTHAELVRGRSTVPSSTRHNQDETAATAAVPPGRWGWSTAISNSTGEMY